MGAIGDDMGMSKFIWSETVGTMIARGFTTRAVLIRKDGAEKYKVCKPLHWTWNEADAVYYRDDVDDFFTFEVPENGVERDCYKAGYRKRWLVTIG